MFFVQGNVGQKRAHLHIAGIEGFTNVAHTHIEAALPVLKRNGVPLLVHAEVVDDREPQARHGVAFMPIACRGLMSVTNIHGICIAPAGRALHASK